MLKKKFPSLTSIGSDGNTAFLRAARAGNLEKVLEQLKNNVDINTSNANGLNALHLASKDGHTNVVSELLKRGAKVDSATKKGNTALHIASLAGQEEVVRLLVEHGACVNVQSQNGFTPLYMAAQENHDAVVRFLLASGANQSLATEDGFTPLAVAMQQGHDKVVAVLLENDTRGKVRLPALHIAAKKDDCKAAALLLQNEHNPDVTSKSGFTPLHIASHYGNEGIAELLLSRGADVNYAAKHNITPLHVAAKWGKANMVSVLLSKGANIEAKTRDGLTPLHCAARSGHEQVVDMLLERGAPISSKTKNGLAALHMAAQGDHVDAARILLYHRAPVDDVTVDYLTALHVAAHCGHVGVARLLLDRKADPNARALNGFTPLHIACKKNRIKVVELLLKHGASIEATTESGLTPLHVASFMGCMNIVIYLVQNEASPDVKTVRGETPLHLAARANQTDIIRILLRNGAQVDARAREQQTPLHIASRLGNVDIVMLLLQHGANADSTTKDLYTALHIAAKEGQEEVASVLLENGASLESTTKKGFTPLHLAAKYGHMNVAKLLLRRDAPADAQGKNGVTPLHVASHYDHQNVALHLLEKGASPHATAKNGHTPLHIAARKNQMDIATTLLEYGAKASAESKAGFTPLHLAAQEGHADMSNLLIEHQADINHKAKNGLAPLHLCSQEDRINVATALIKNGANVNVTTKAEYTPLHVASHFGQIGMVRLLLANGASLTPTTAVNYTPLHQAAQQGHSAIVNELLTAGANPNATTNQGQTPLAIAQKLGYISVVEVLKGVTDTPISPTSTDEKYKVVAPETMQETFMSDSEDEGGEDTMLGEQPYHYLTVDEMKGLGDDSLPIDVTRDERDNRDMGFPTAIDDPVSPQHMKESYASFTATDNVDITRHPQHIGFLVSFLVDARGGAMRGCRHSGVRIIVPPRRAPMPLRVTCRYLKRDKLPHPPPLMEGEALASRILELGPVGAKFLGPVMIEVPHFGALRGKEREIVILRSDNGETWREHTFEASEEAIHEVMSHSFDNEEMLLTEDGARTTRILTTEFPHYIAVVSRVRQEVHAIGPEGGMVSSTVVPQVQAVFPHGALTKKIKVGLQAQPIPAELTAKLLGNRVAVSPIVTVEPRRRKFHKPISLTIPVPQAANKGMINQYSGDAPTLRLLCSITGGTTRAQWEDVTGSTPLTFVNDCVSFTTTVSARFWLMDCRNISEATKMATELYREAIHVPFMAKFVVFAKRVDTAEARLRVFCMTDDKEDKTLEHQEHFMEVAKSRDVEVLEGKMQYLEFTGNLVPVTKSGEQLHLGFRAFKENRLPFIVRVKDPHADSIGRLIFMREPKVAKGDVPQQPACILNIVLPEEIIPEADLPDHGVHKHSYITHTSGLQRLSDISNLLGEDWVRLAGVLGVSQFDVNNIKTEMCESSVAHQGLAMLRLWLQEAGNKASAAALEEGLRSVGRDDIIEQTVFNVDRTSPYAVSGELCTLYTTKHDVLNRPSADRGIINEIRVDERSIKKDVWKDKDDKDEKKYEAEEKAVDEESLKSVTERKEEIEKRLSKEKDASKSSVKTIQQMSDKDSKPPTGKQTTNGKQKKLLDDATEKEIAEEKAVSPEPAHMPFDEKRKSFEMGITPKEMITKLESTQMFLNEERRAVRKDAKETVTEKIDEKDKEEEKLTFLEKRKSFEQASSFKDVGDKSRTEEAKNKKEEAAAVEKRESNFRRDSQLFEEVSEGLGRIDTESYKTHDLLSPSVVKTPPPSPAEFNKESSANKRWSGIESKRCQEQEERQPKLEKGGSTSSSKERSPENDNVGKDPAPQRAQNEIQKDGLQSQIAAEQNMDEFEILPEALASTKELPNKTIQPLVTEGDDIGKLIQEMESQLLICECEEETLGKQQESLDESPQSDFSTNSKPVVTTPTFSRRVTRIGGSQRLPEGAERPVVRIVTDFAEDSDSEPDEESYTVVEPIEKPPKRTFKIRFSPDMYTNSEDSVDVPEEVVEAGDSTVSSPPVDVTQDKGMERIERHFERLSSEINEADIDDIEKSGGVFENVVSQMSVVEMDQALHVWDEGGLAPCEVDSKEITSTGVEPSTQQEGSHTLEPEEKGDTQPVPPPRVQIKPLPRQESTPKQPDSETEQSTTYASNKSFWEQMTSVGSLEETTPPVPKPRTSLSHITDIPASLTKHDSAYSKASSIHEVSELGRKGEAQYGGAATEDVARVLTGERSFSQDGDTASELEYIRSHDVEELSYDNDAFDDDKSFGFPKRSMYERSISLPADSASDVTVRVKKRIFEEHIKKEMVVEQLMSQLDEDGSPERKSLKNKNKELPKLQSQVMMTRQIHSDIFSHELDEQIDPNQPEDKSILQKKITTETCKPSDTAEVHDYKRQAISKPSDSLEVHVDKSELEDAEKAREVDVKPPTFSGADVKVKPENNVQISSVTSSQGESEDTFSESDVTPDEARFKEEADNQDWTTSTMEKERLHPGRSDDLRRRSVHTPEEHIPDTVWEVPVQEESINAVEEMAQSLRPITVAESEISENEAREIAETVIGSIERELSLSDLKLETETKQEEKTIKMQETVSISKDTLKFNRTDTTTSSMEITDEDLRSSGVNSDNSPLESQASHQIIPADDPSTADVSEEFELHGQDHDYGKYVLDKTLAEVKESLEAVKEELIEDKKKKRVSITKESPSEFEFKALTLENTSETIQEHQIEDISGVLDQKQVNVAIDIKTTLEKSTDKETKDNLSIKSENGKHEIKLQIDKKEEENFERTTKQVIEADVEDSLKTRMKQIKEENVQKQRIETHETRYTHEQSSNQPQTDFKPDDRKSPTEDLFSTSSSSDCKASDDTHTLNKPAIVIRKHKRATDIKTDAEIYSSSGESHYQSFEQTSDSARSPGSRPLSSDIEGLVGYIATGSSEYESVLSHESSAQSTTVTSKDFHTAASSLSSRDSMKSLDSESSGNLASVEISSEASETLVPSAMELERDDDIVQATKSDRHNFEDDHRNVQSFSDSIVQSVSFDMSAEDISEDDENQTIDLEFSKKMKRSHEMTFQPEPRPIADKESLVESASSLDDMTSLVSGSSEAPVTIVERERSRTESDRMDGSATSEQLSLTVSVTSEGPSMSESRDPEGTSITMMTCVESVETKSKTDTESGPESIIVKSSSSNELDVSTQVTLKTTSRESSHSNGPTQVEYNAEYDNEHELKKRGHRRNGSTSFKPSMIPVYSGRDKKEKRSEEIVEDSAESDMYKETLTKKENSQDEKKDTDESEKLEEFYQTEADQGFHRDIREGRVYLEEGTSMDESSTKSRLPSSVFSEDRPDSELAELLKQSSSDIPTEDPIERPRTPEPMDEYEIQHDTPEFSPEAQRLMDVTEFEMEHSRAVRCQEDTHVVEESHTSHRTIYYPEMEKHEFETQEQHSKDEIRNIYTMSVSPVPDITVTQHSSQYQQESVDMENTEIEKQVSPQMSPKSGTDEEKDCTPKDVAFGAPEKIKDEHESDSPTSDSFEMLEKPDISDEFVIIEEVAKEAEEGDTEGKSRAIQGRTMMTRVRAVVEKPKTAQPPSLQSEQSVCPPKDRVNDDIPFNFDTHSSPAKCREVSQMETSPPFTEDQNFKMDLEAGKKWIEMQFQGEPVAQIYGYDIEFERGPLEDIKEEDINDLESSSKIGSVGSQVSHSIGSFGSVKESLSSTPDYDVLAGRKYFTRSGEHDDVSMSSLQEFERLENLIALESTKTRSAGSQGSLTSSSNSGKHGNKSGGDDISLASLKEFEGLEKACIAAETIERKAKAEEDLLLSEIEEGHESQASESASCHTVSAGILNRVESDEDDYERRMFEIDEIIRQAQTNVEHFMETKVKEGHDTKCETLGRADSLEEISKVPELDLDQPQYQICGSGKSYIQQWDLNEELLTSTDSLDVKTQISKTIDPFTTSTDSLEVKPSNDVMSLSTDSIDACQKSKKKGFMTDSIEGGEKTSMITSSDSLEGKVTQASSIDEDEHHGAQGYDHSSSSSKDEALGAVGMTTNRMPPPRSEFLHGSSDSLDPTSSTATHATYQYETDSVMSSSFTSGDSATMVDDCDDFNASREPAGIYFEDGKPYVTEVIEPIIDDDDFSHVIHRTVEMPPQVQKISFKGEGAEKALKEYMEKFDQGEDVSETRHVDKDGNVHVKRVVQRRVILKPEEMGDLKDLTGTEWEKCVKSLSESRPTESLTPTLESVHSFTETHSFDPTGYSSTTSTLGQGESETSKSEQEQKDLSGPQRRAGTRPPLKYDISVDEEPDFDPQEHAWRFNLQTHIEDEENFRDLASGNSGALPSKK